MAYKYENKINDAFFKAGRSGRNVNKELLNELQEVYQKAKVYNKIKNIITAGDNVAMDTDSILIEVKKHINDMGDE